MFNLLTTKPFGNGFTIPEILFNLAFSFLLSIIIAYSYQKNHRGLSYSQGFAFTLAITGIIICSVMMIIGNNIARAFGAFGAFSLIRFRTAIKDTKDMSYIFLVLAIGMAIGTNNYVIAISLSVFAIAIISGLTKYKFGYSKKYDYILTFNLSSQHSAKTDIYKKIFNHFLKSNDLLNVSSLDGGKLLELNFSIQFKDEKQKQEFIQKLNNQPGISQINLIAAKNDIEF